MNIINLPDGSAFNAGYVAAITWSGAFGSGEYRQSAGIRIFASKSSLLGGSSVEQIHYIRMESDEAARETCEALVRRWRGEVVAMPMSRNETQPEVPPDVPGEPVETH
jgi:hypothetical protein